MSEGKKMENTREMTQLTISERSMKTKTTDVQPRTTVPQVK